MVSPDEDLLAWSVDRTGDEVYELRFRDLRTGTDLDEVVPRSYYGGAWSADSHVVLLHRPRPGLPALPGVAAPGRDAGRRRRPGARGARRALRPQRPRHPQRRRDPGAQREPRHRRDAGRSTRPRPSRRPARWAVGDRACSTAPSTSRESDAAAAGDQRRRRRVPADVRARSRATPTRTTRPGPRCAPSSRGERLLRADAFAAGVVLDRPRATGSASWCRSPTTTWRARAGSG